MIILINVGISETPLHKLTSNGVVPFDRGILPDFDKLEIFEYMLASLDPLESDLTVINCEFLDGNIPESEKEGLAAYWQACLLPHHKCVIKFTRNVKQADWVNQIREIQAVVPDYDAVWFCCNHDHIYMNHGDSVQPKNLWGLLDYPGLASLYFSHWPELLGKVNQKNGTLKWVDWQNADSIQILNRKLFEHWWLEHDYVNMDLPRSDWINGQHILTNDYRCFVPNRELCRHFDGYSHVGISPNICPALAIPEGFFDSQIRIRWGFEENLPGWVNINSTKLDYTAVNPNGTDYKWVPNDVPQFWFGRIAEEVFSIDYDIDKQQVCRDKAIMDVARLKFGPFMDESFLNPILEENNIG